MFTGDQCFMIFRDQGWFDRLSTLRRGDKITVIGQITRVNGIEIQLENCEIVDS